jgi:hypothetical protein
VDKIATLEKKKYKDHIKSMHGREYMEENVAKEKLAEYGNKLTKEQMRSLQ